MRRDTFSIEELERLTGIPARTIRFYVTQDLLASPRGRGPHTQYNRGHLDRLKIIQNLKSTRMALDAIKEQLAVLSDADVASLVEAEPTTYEEEQWRHVPLHPDIVLLIRERANDEFNENVRRLIDVAQEEADRLP